MAFDTSMFLRGYNPAPIESRANALMRGLEVRNQQQGSALNALKLQAFQQAQVDELAKAQRQQAIEQAYRNALETPLQQAGAAGMTRPTPANAAAIGQMQPRFNPQRLAQELMPIAPMEAAKLLTPQAADLVSVGPGAALVDKRTGKPIYQAPFKPEGEKTPEALRTLAAIFGEGTPEYLAAARQLATKMTTNAPAVSVSYGTPISAINPQTGQTELVRPDNQGGMKFTGVKPAGDSDKPLTEGQAKAVVYASRMLSADQTLAELNRKGVFASVPGSRLPGVGGVVNAMSPADQQRLDQAKRDFINAVLRRESGAVIADSEFENADKQYFPQIGDSREVREQKARNRRVAIEGIRADVPKSKQGEVDRISGAGAPAAADDSDPLGLRRK